MSERKLLGFIKAQYGAPGPASGVTYDIKVNDGDQTAIYAGVVPSSLRPCPELDVAVIDVTKNPSIDVWDIEGVLHFHFTEPVHTAECSAPPAPLIDRIVSALGQATAAQKAVIRSALGLAPAGEAGNA